MRSPSLAALTLTALLICALAGCIGDQPKNPAATQPVTVGDPATASAAYWAAQPPTVQVAGSDFNVLWDTCENVAHDYFFDIDLRDYRRGVLKTAPVVSKQLLEFWRKDAGTFEDVKEDTLGPIRRTIYFQLTSNKLGACSVAPKVVVERQSKVDPKYQTTDSDEPNVYWYALRRDPAMEAKLAEAIQKKLGTESAGR